MNELNRNDDQIPQASYGMEGTDCCPVCGSGELFESYDETFWCPECDFHAGASRKEFWCPNCETYNMIFTSDRAVCPDCGCTVLLDYDGPSEWVSKQEVPGKFKLLHVRKAEVLPEIKKLSHSFSEFTELEAVILPEGLEELDYNAFWGCSALKTVNIPKSVRKIGGGSFCGCAFTEIQLPEGLDEIAELTFCDCPNLKSLSLPETVSRIGDAAFQRCTALEEILIPEGVTHIGEGAFRGCTNLRRVVMPKSVVFMGDRVFEACPNVTVESKTE